jgi:FlaA1/EpsC-like NDP-sugar epimerase
LLLDSSEFSLYQLEAELALTLNSNAVLTPLLGSILNPKQLLEIMKNFQVQTVYHTAAYKHVPMVEKNIIEGIRNNVLGTWYVAQAAHESQVESFVFISSDKAVRPTNVMGATKRLAELIIQSYVGRNATTIFCTVRFGNVLQSSGSVVPLFRQQIDSGGPVTVTHRQATRYFMTASEAAELVLQASAMAEGGELFMLDMGDTINIYDLAVSLIQLSGLSVATDKNKNKENGAITIDIIGLRPGEKLREELAISQAVSGTPHQKILRVTEDSLDWETVEWLCRSIKKSCDNGDYEALSTYLEHYVVGYKRYGLHNDPLYKQTPRKNRQSTITTLYPEKK